MFYRRCALSLCRFVVAGLLVAGLEGAGVGQQAAPLYRNSEAPMAARVDDLVGRMTLEEKVSQMQNTAPAIARLGVPAYQWWTEGLHGLARLGHATLFPQAIGLAATWDTTLMQRVADTISTEARAKNADARRRQSPDLVSYGLDLWSPNINIFRDPRWGRGQETYGEDPYLTARLGVAFVRGLQGDDPVYFKTIATPKHYAVHSGPESTRHIVNIDPSPHDLEDTYLPAFRATVTEAKAGSVMCAYNSVDGAPACANAMLLEQTLRKAWKFDGYVTSDCGAIRDIATGHHFAPDLEHASASALRAGTDTSCGREYETLTRAVQQGLVTERELDVAVRRLFMARFRLGLFDPPEKVAYARMPSAELDSEPHRALARMASEEAMVLLKNDGILPFRSGRRRIAVIGPNAAMLASIEGNYNANPSHPVVPLDGMEARFGAANVVYAQGSPLVPELPVPVPRSLLRPGVDGAGMGLKGEYFRTPDFAGAPALTRVDSQVDFDWNAAPPVPGLEASAFSVRWSGTLAVPVAGDYVFSFHMTKCYPCAGTESVRVFFDGKEIPRRAPDSAENKLRMREAFHVHLPDTRPRSIRIDYVHQGKLQNAGISLEWRPPIVTEREQAVRAARKADVVVAFVGLSPELEGEEMPIHIAGFDEGDRTSIELPAVQEELLEAVHATGKPLVVVLMNGSALSVEWAKSHANAILEAWYPGEEAGHAIARTLTGENNPAGRLPVTFYAGVGQIPAFDDYGMANRTYRYFRGRPLWPFGYGLSYSEFRWSDLKLSANRVDASTAGAGEPLTVTATVENMSSRAGDAVSELYVTPPQVAGAPALSLEGFSRLHLLPRERRVVTFALDARQLSTVSVTGERRVVAGEYGVSVGGGQPDRGSGVGYAQGRFTVSGSLGLPK